MQNAHPNLSRVRLGRPAICFVLLITLLISVGGGVLAENRKHLSVEQAIEEQGLDWSTTDYGRSFGLGALPDGAQTKKPQSDTSLKLDLLPSALDWRDHDGNWVSPIRDQGGCGSCWAFASVAALESQLALGNAIPDTFVDLSEQIMISCDDNNDGCMGGSPGFATAFLRESGTSLETCYPYIGAKGSCGDACADWRSVAVKIMDYEPVQRSVFALKQALQGGPFQVTFDVYMDFYGYREGIYEHATGDLDGAHAVLLVGYQDTPGSSDGGGHFIVKNSWSEAWGESGYFRIGYNQVDNEVAFGKWAYRYFMGSGDDAYEPDNDAPTATTLTAGVAQQHSLRPAGDSDWYVFHLDAEHDVTLDTNGVIGGDLRMWLYDDSLAQLAYDDDGATDYYASITATLPAGTYYVQIKGFLSESILSAYEIVLSGMPAPFSQPLLTGWNLVSIPRIPLTDTIQSYLASVDGLYDGVMSYDNANQLWTAYSPQVPEPLNSLASLDEATPFWINMLQSGTLQVTGEIPLQTQQALETGWNLVAYPAQDARDIATALQSISGHLINVYTYDLLNGTDWLRYGTDRPTWTNTLTVLNPGSAYWVEVDAPCVLVISN